LPSYDTESLFSCEDLPVDGKKILHKGTLSGNLSSDLKAQDLPIFDGKFLTFSRESIFFLLQERLVLWQSTSFGVTTSWITAFDF